jgi:hypothetical protein
MWQGSLDCALVGLRFFPVDAEAKFKQPLLWQHADLGPVKHFLKQAIADGKYHPAFEGGLD